MTERCIFVGHRYSHRWRRNNNILLTGFSDTLRFLNVYLKYAPYTNGLKSTSRSTLLPCNRGSVFLYNAVPRAENCTSNRSPQWPLKLNCYSAQGVRSLNQSMVDMHLLTYDIRMYTQSNAVPALNYATRRRDVWESNFNTFSAHTRRWRKVRFKPTQIYPRRRRRKPGTN